MPSYTDLVLYFNIGFLAIVGFAVLGGLMRGLKKTLVSLISMVLFYGIFFFTIDMVVGFLYGMELPFIGQLIAMVMPNEPALTSVTSFQQLVSVSIETFAGDTIQLSGMSEGVGELVTGLGIFVVKIVYTILYFTVGLILWKIVFGILSSIFISKPTKGSSNNPLLGGVVGALKGVIAVFVSLIMLGGIVNVAQSILVIGAPLLEVDEPTDLFHDPNRDVIYQASYTIIPLAEPTDEDLASSIQSLQDLVNAFNDNLVVGFFNTVTIAVQPDSTIQVPLYLYLFDSVISFPFGDQKVALRHELAVFAAIGGIFLESEFQTTQDPADITSDEILQMFTLLAQSNFVVSAMPVAIEFANDYFESGVELDIEQLNQVNWRTEIENLGVILSTVFEILNNAGFVSGEGDLETIEVDGDLVRELFDSLGTSELLLIAVEVFLVPLVENDEGTLGKLLTIPAGLDWQAEFSAIGQLIGAILDANISIEELQEGSISVIINAISQIDLTLLLNSRLISNMMINVLSGNAGIEGLDVLTVPNDIVWLDELDGLGNIVVPGELRNILLAINAIAAVAGTLDFENLGLSTISNLTDDTIDTLFNSRILVATISTLILTQDLGGETLIVPDSVFDNQGYLLKEELKSIAKAIKLIVVSAVCDPSDDDCEEESFDVSKILALTSVQLNTLFDSQIIAATVGNLVKDLGADLLVIPSTVLVNIFVDQQAVQVVSAAELKNVIAALKLLGLSDFDSIEFGPAILNNLELIPEVGDPVMLDDDKIATLLGSDIIYATVSKMILDLTAGSTDFLVVPSKDITNVSLTAVLGGQNVIVKSEISALLKAFYALDVEDFNELSTFSVQTIIDEIDTLLESAILHATFSKQILDLGAPVSVPSFNDQNLAIIVQVESVTYITKAELEAFVKAIEVFGISDLSAFSGTISLAILGIEANRNKILASAILHQTISSQLFDVQGTTLEIPSQDESGNAIIITTGVIPNQINFIAKSEIHALIIALIEMGFGDLGSFSGSINSSSFFDEAAVLFASSVIQATISKQLLTQTNGALKVPNGVRVTQGTTEYILKTELLDLIDSLDLLGLTDFSSLNFNNPAALFALDSNVLFASKSIQATVSDVILDIADDESAPDGASTLIVPTLFRESIVVGATNTFQIELVELKALFVSLDSLGVTDFGASFNASVITSMDEAELTLLLASASIHVTVDKMLKGNNNIASDIPALAKATIYTIPNTLLKSEIIDFILASQVIGGDFTSVNFSFAAIQALSPEQQDIALGSMIVRNILTPQIELATQVKDPLYVIPNNYYEENNTALFLTSAGAKSLITFINS